MAAPLQLVSGPLRSTEREPDKTIVRRTLAFTSMMIVLAAAEAGGQSLRGSSVSLSRQNSAAKAHDFSYLDTSNDVRRFVASGYLVRVSSNADLMLSSGVSFPYARPEVKLFAERLARQYRSACGEKLVVTSLTRPWSRQPSNGSSRSVHPTGMALDLRKSSKGSCQRWLERTLLSLEGSGVLEATRERRPPHYHVAVFPRPYRQHVAMVTNGKQPSTIAQGTVRTASVLPVPSFASERSTAQYRVHRGDTLWDIARKHGTTVEQLKELNRLRSARIAAGQVIMVPVAD